MKRLKNNGLSASSNASFLFRGIYGRNTNRSSSSGTTKSLRFGGTLRLFACLLAWFYFWLSPSEALAEWTSAQISTLGGKINDLIDENRSQTDELENINSALVNYLIMKSSGNSIGSGVYQIADYTNRSHNRLVEILQLLGYGVGSSQSGTVKESLFTIDYDINALKNNLGFSDTTTLRAKLDEIILALENLQESGSGSESESISQDWVKEDTFNAFSAKYEELANRAYNAFGFNSGSDYSLKDYLDSFIPVGSVQIYTTTYSEGSNSTPFPDSPYKWSDKSQSITYRTGGNLYEFLGDLFYYNRESESNLLLNIAKKQAWNDWQAHTNLVATITGLVTQPENRVDSSEDIGIISERDGNQFLEVTYEKETGDAFEEINLTPTLTNDVASLEVESTSITNKFNKIWNYKKIKERYIDESKINLENSYNDVTTRDSTNFVLQYGTENYMTYDWGGNALLLYREIFSYDRMRTLRGVFGYLWQILISFSCYCLFRVLGKVK